MVIALYGNIVDKEHKGDIELLFGELAKRGAEVIVYAPFLEFLRSMLGHTPQVKAVYRTPGEVKHLANFMISIGGDGTFLESVSFIEDSCVPMVGINFGRLGFLAHISSEDIPSAIEQIFNKMYTVEKRSALELVMDNNPFENFPFGLNDFTLQKKGTAMITINTYIDGEFLCTYWSDGLIVSTPTGSTAYSLSVGGPILSPTTSAFVISPIAPHNLTVRPLVIPDSSTLTLKATTRDNEILMSLDSRSVAVGSSLTATIKKASFCVGVVNLRGNNYFKTLRNKLMWGADTRNTKD
jgi:NAD+ kinase